MRETAIYTSTLHFWLHFYAYFTSVINTLLMSKCFIYGPDDNSDKQHTERYKTYRM